MRVVLDTNIFISILIRPGDTLRALTQILDRRATMARSRDADDDKFLSLAASGHADYLITGDQDLLVLRQANSTKIVSPTQFVSFARNET